MLYFVFFTDSLRSAVGYHCLKTDIGTVQRSPLRTDTQATLRDLERFIPFDKDLAAKTAESITHLGCRLALCDIAPMGMAIAHQAGIPSVLIENVTWDWIYQGYRSEFFHPDLIADEMGGFIL
jgi:hypothetical protein